MTEAAMELRYEDAIVLTPEKIEEYMQTLRSRNLTRETLTTYQRNMNLLYASLPEEKEIRRGTLDQICSEMEKAGYARQTINSVLTTANGFVGYCGHKEFQGERRKDKAPEIQPELTRAEYLRLLSTARTLGQERTYLLVKVFATLGLTILELHTLTVEAVIKGSIMRGEELRTVPSFLRQELLDYVSRQGIVGGPIFLNNEGEPMSRTHVNNVIKALSRDSRVEAAKCTPRCLKKLCQQTRQNVRDTLAVLYEQTYERILEQEQLVVGWK